MARKPVCRRYFKPMQHRPEPGSCTAVSLACSRGTDWGTWTPTSEQQLVCFTRFFGTPQEGFVASIWCPLSRLRRAPPRRRCDLISPGRGYRLALTRCQPADWYPDAQSRVAELSINA